jgi:uncharacterized protein YukE
MKSSKKHKMTMLKRLLKIIKKYRNLKNKLMKIKQKLNSMSNIWIERWMGSTAVRRENMIK